jgi:choloylglycine hydrolase
MSDANSPNIAMTLWRTVADQHAKIFYFESAVFPAVSWIDMKKVDLTEGASPKTIRIERGSPLAGELSAKLKAAEPFKWLGAK